MAKRILAALIATAIALVGLIVFWCVFFRFPIPGEDYGRFALAAALLASSVYIFRRSRRGPGFLLLVGSVAFVLLKTHDALVQYMFKNHLDMIQQRPWWWPTCTENPRILHALLYLLFPILCLPVAWFWYSFHFAERHLTDR